MSARQIALGLLFLVGVAAIITAVAYFVNIRLFSGNQWGSSTPHEAFLVEGLLFLVSGFLLLVGGGGIDFWAIREAFGRRIWGRVAVDTSEPVRRERSKPQGLVGLALVLLIAGFFMLVLYFLG